MPSSAPPPHLSRVFSTPWPGVYATDMESGRHFGRHSHATYGMGFVVAGAHRSASGRGIVDAYAGDVITTNPGEVHDGRPLGADTRRWRMVHLEPAVLASMAGTAFTAGGAATDLALTRPVLSDAPLRRSLIALLRRLERWHAPSDRSRDDALACDEALVHACGLLLARHATAARRADTRGGNMALVRERLADGLLDPPSLAELACVARAGRFQLLRHFRATYGVTPYAWLLQQRAERARSLIGQGTPLVQAAALSGFADQSHMTRLFVRQFGFTPGAWQQAAGRRPRLQ